jgi:hypothetical protein
MRVLKQTNKKCTLKSADPATSKTLFGCQSIEVIVERMGFFICFDTHQSFSLSK